MRKNIKISFKQSLINKAVTFSRKQKMFFAIILDIVICIFATWISFSIEFSELMYFDLKIVYASLVSIGLAISIFFFFGIYKMIFRYINSDSFQVFTKAIIIYTLVFYFLFGFIELYNIPKSIGLSQPMLLFLVINFSRLLVKKVFSQYIEYANLNSKSKTEVIICGTGQFGRQLAFNLKNNNEFKLLFFVDNNRDLWDGTIDGFQVKSPSYLKTFANVGAVKQLWLTNSEISKKERNELIISMAGLPYHIKILPTFSDLTHGKVYLRDLRELNFDDLLDREPIKPNKELLEKCVRNKTILITGAGGSIGSEISQQILENNPQCIVLIEISEVALYHLHSKLSIFIKKQKNPIFGNILLIPLLVNILDEQKLDNIFRIYKPYTVYHVAAFKHVPIVEQNIVAGITNNVIGTLKCANVSIKHKVKHFVFVSTDKAVRPTNIMGASKRLAEMFIQTMNNHPANKNTWFCMVRFGNVIGSSGSVIPLFQEQIEAGGPITLTHTDVTRYFMTIQEAAQLVIQAGAMSKGGEVFVLDMGKSIRIFDLAKKMIMAKGLQLKDDQTPWGDIEIEIQGLRPGEKLYEELLIGNNPQKTDHPRILQANEKYISKDKFDKLIEELILYLEKNNTEKIRQLLKKTISGYVPNKENVDLLNNFEKI